MVDESTTPTLGGGGTRVACGRHVVPSPIAVERLLDNDPKLSKKQLVKELPQDVKTLLQAKGVEDVYDRLVKKWAKKACSSETGCWKEPQMVSILNDDGFQAELNAKGIQVALCILYSEDKAVRWMWIEYIDTKHPANTEYVPPFDVSHHQVAFSGQLLLPPSTVVVAEVLDDLVNSRIVTQCPPEVQSFLESKPDLKDTYDRFTQALMDSKTTRTWADTWKTKEVSRLLQEDFQDEFKKFNVEVAVCKSEKMQKKWLEFIDRDQDPNYIPQHDVDLETKQLRRLASTSNVGTVSDSGMRSSGLLGSSSSGNNAASAGVAVQALLVEGQPQLAEFCPPDVEALLERRGISMVDYGKLDQAISQSNSLKNFFDIWRLTQEGLVTFDPLDSLRKTFDEKGVSLVLCETIGKSGKQSFWMEYVDTELMSDYSSPYDVCYESRGQRLISAKEMLRPVVGGRHQVPQGVFVEELDDSKKLSDACPPDVKDLLHRKGLEPVYDKMIETLVTSKKTRSWAENWKSAEIGAVVKEYEPEFAAKEVKLVFCKYIPDQGTSFRWFEFVDTAVAPNYVAQYDIHNDGGDELQTMKTVPKFPVGVAVKELTDDRNEVVKHTPPSVDELMTKKDCYDLYVALMDVIYESGMGQDEGWSEHQIRRITQVLDPKFEAKGVSLFFSFLRESEKEQNKDEEKTFYWLEFVDRDLQPNYTAQRGIDVKRLSPQGMNSDEIATAVISSAVGLATAAPVAVGYAALLS